VLAAEIFDTAPHDGLAGLPKSAETEALENLGDSKVMRALGDLPECFKVAVYLADVQGYRYSEVADLTGAPLGTVMSRIHRGLGTAFAMLVLLGRPVLGDLLALGLGQLARHLALGHLGALHLMPDRLDHLWVGQRGDIADVGEVRHRRDHPAHDLP